VNEEFRLEYRKSAFKRCHHRRCRNYQLFMIYVFLTRNDLIARIMPGDSLLFSARRIPTKAQ